MKEVRNISIFVVLGMLICMIASAGISVQANPIEIGLIRQFGTNTSDIAWTIAVDTNENTYIAGETLGAFPGQIALGKRDSFVRKYNSNGDEVWTRQFGTNEVDGIGDAAVDSVGNVYVIGALYGALPGQIPAGGHRDCFIRKYDPNGNILWTHQFGTFGVDAPFGVTTDSNDNVYIVGSVPSALPGQTCAGGHDGFVRKYDKNGGEIWTYQFGIPQEDWVVAAAINDNEDVYLLGSAYDAFPGQVHNGDKDVFVRKIDSNRNVLWTHQFGTPSWDIAHDIGLDPFGNVYVVGRTSGNLTGPIPTGPITYGKFVCSDTFVKKYDSDGNQIWIRQFGNLTGGWKWGLDTDDQGNVYVAGGRRVMTPDGQSSTPSQLYARKYNSIGDDLWTYQLGTYSATEGHDIAIGKTGAVYISGTTSGILPGQASKGGGDGFLLKLIQNETLPISAINIDPDTLNLKSKGRWITCYITLNNSFDVNNINISTILLENTIPAEWGNIQDDTLMVKFDRSEVEDMLSPGTYNLKVTGELTDGTAFEGYSDEIRVIDPPK